MSGLSGDFPSPPEWPAPLPRPPTYRFSPPVIDKEQVVSVKPHRDQRKLTGGLLVVLALFLGIGSLDEGWGHIAALLFGIAGGLLLVTPSKTK
jgi:hypothetical protein